MDHSTRRDDGSAGTGTVDAPQMPAAPVREHPAHSLSGALGLLLAAVGPLLGIGLALAGIAVGFNPGDRTALGVVMLVLGVLLAIAALFAWNGVKMVAPGEARVIQLFGRYVGTLRTDGLRWVNPLTSSSKISTRVRNHETAVLKVNDAGGSPIEIAAVIVWQVEDTAQATFGVDDYEEFVTTQAETALRHIATNYPYEADQSTELSLRDNAESITDQLSAEVNARVAAAGVHVIESRFTHLAYAPEIAAAMLQRQQAGAIIAARQQIVEGACGMVETAVARITERDFVHLDEERKAAMVSNLLVVLCGDRGPQPVVNTGTLYP
ncbi:SPFH domain-containing protein [Streptomyces sp. TRM 70351]|uniref:SPFH domain-containing protein n=1 Tax=Streptomyces sp. TRM 70351 TaxID=3116552 RepID=UPI002E7B2704|nr:SPFH domain-containing protein [Streptomyces sp. TRM 70351]MEE1927782.1 SPFH domain-containing protein [Streptomyces sp. TRM 70351]